MPAALAIMLTFARSGMLPFEDLYTPIDMAMNVFVVVVAPLYALKDSAYMAHNRIFPLLIPMLCLIFWVLINVFVGSPEEYWPKSTAMITIVLSIFLATQITCFELRRLRHMVLLLTGIFCCYLLLFGASTVSAIVGGTMEGRLGADLSPYNLIVLPRIMYMLIFTCLVSIVIEQNRMLKIAAAVMAVLPLLVALATGGRGSLFAFVIALIVFVAGLRSMNMKLILLLLASAFLATVYFLADNLMPILLHRIQEGDDSNRFEIWSNLFDPSNISLFGKGVVEDYPHNIFLELFVNHGIIGFLFFLMVLFISIRSAYIYYKNTYDIEALWLFCLLVLQLTAQQLSLDIFYGSFWAALLLPLVLYNSGRYGAVPAPAAMH